MERKKQSKIDINFIRSLDKLDNFNKYRKQFKIPNKFIYFGANTLGLTPQNTITLINNFYKDLSENGVLGWRDNNWLKLNKLIGNKIAKIIGSKSSEVILSDSTSVNLFKLLYSAVKLGKNKKRKIILTDNKNFPTDNYIISGLARDLGLVVKFVPRGKLIQNINRDILVVSTTQVDFVSGEVLDLEILSNKAQKYGSISLIDLSHSVGILPLYLDKWNIDFAVGCTYKYLNGGPGSPAFIYVNKKHVHKTEIILQGWFGHKKPFNFEFKYSPYQGVEKYLTGTPSIISMKQLEASLNIYSKLNIVKLRKKSFSQTSLLIELISKHYETSNIKVISPGGSCRGGHVAITHPNAAKLIKAYENNGLLGDYRPPNVIRFGISPVYNSYNDIWNAAKIINKRYI